MASPVAGLTGNGSMVAVLAIGPGNSTAMFMGSQALGPAPRAPDAVRVCPEPRSERPSRCHHAASQRPGTRNCAYRQDRSCPSHALGGTHGIR